MVRLKEFIEEKNGIDTIKNKKKISMHHFKIKANIYVFVQFDLFV